MGSRKAAVGVWVLAGITGLSAAGQQSSDSSIRRDLDVLREIIDSRGRDPESVRLDHVIALREAKEPFEVASVDGHRAVWVSQSEAAIAARRHRTALMLEALQSINPETLPRDAKIDWRVLLNQTTSNNELSRFPMEYAWPDWPEFDPTWRITEHPHDSAGDYRDILAWLHGVPLVFGELRDTLQRGVARSVVADREVVASLMDSVRRIAPEEPMASPYLAVFRQFPESVPPPEQKVLLDEALGVYRSEILPQAAKLLLYLDKTYLPAARSSGAMTGLPDGLAWYAALIRNGTGMVISPEEIHQAGLLEVRRVRADIETAARGAGFTGSYSEFIAAERRDPRCGPLDAKAMRTQFLQTTRAVEAQLPRLFGTIPKTPYQVKVAGALPPGGVMAMARPGSLKDGRPGEVLVQVPVANRCGFAAVLLHEALPGHLFQSHIASESSTASKHLGRYWLAFTEGWAHYVGGLGAELGLRPDAYEQAERATGEMFMAVRAVIDTGIHAKGWTRGQAIEFYKAALPWAPPGRAETQVDAITQSPARFLSYLVGEQKFIGLRRFAEAELGSRFDVRAFHDEVLRNGQLPLDVLDIQIREWVAAEKRKGAATP